MFRRTGGSEGSWQLMMTKGGTEEEEGGREEGGTEGREGRREAMPPIWRIYVRGSEGRGGYM